MKTNLKIYTLLVFIGMISTSISAQEVLNITKIPNHIVSHQEANEIRIENGKYIVPIYGAEHNIYEYLPAMEVDSFVIPNYVFFGDTNAIGATMFASYEPFIGFTDKFILNYNKQNNDVHFDGDYASYVSNKPYFGMNDNFPYELPSSNEEYDSKQSRIAVYNIDEDTFIYKQTFGQGALFDLTSAIQGDFVYVNIPLTYNYDDDLPFMGDTLIFPFESWGTSCNYVSKINYKTGEKAWTRHVGYGEVMQMNVDDDHRINIDMVSSHPVVYEFESVHSLPDTFYGWYDRLIYRLSPEGDFLEDTYIHTNNDASVREVEFNSDGSFQAIGYVNWPMTVHVEGDSLDFSDATSFDNNKGLVLVYDEYMDYQWGRKIITDGFTLPYAMNKTNDGQYVLATVCESEWIEIEGVKYEGPEAPADLTSEFKPTILNMFDIDGNVEGEPFFGTHRNRIWDIQTLGESHYLLIIEKLTDVKFKFLEEEDYAWESHTYIVEFEGDIFDVMSNLDDYFVDENISISPNPVNSGQQVKVNLPNTIQYGPLQLSLHAHNGALIDYQELSYKAKLDYLVPFGIESGTYYLSISSRDGKMYTPLIIHN